MDQIAEAPPEVETKSEVLDQREVRETWEDFLKFKDKRDDLVGIVDQRLDKELENASEGERELAKLKVMLMIYGVYVADDMNIDGKGSRAAKFMLEEGSFGVTDSEDVFVVQVTPRGEIIFNRKYLIEPISSWFTYLFEDEEIKYVEKTGMSEIEILEYILLGCEEYCHPYDLALNKDIEKDLLREAKMIRDEAEVQGNDYDFFKTYYSSKLEYLGLLIQYEYLKKYLPSSMERVKGFVRDVRDVRRKRSEEEALASHVSNT